MFVNTMPSTITFAAEVSNSESDIDLLSNDVFKFDKNTGTLIQYIGTDSEVTIPSEIDGVKVTRIGNNAFLGCSTLEKVIISDGIQTIGAQAFAKCENLREVVMSNSIFAIENNAFENCRKMTKIKLSENIKSISSKLFFKCESLSEITIPSNVIEILDNAFNGCMSIKSVKFSNVLTTIGDYAFYDCRDLLKIDLPMSLVTIGKYSFSKCTSITDLVLPVGVNSIGHYSFEECSSLKSVKFSPNMDTISNCSFSNCKSLVNVDIPEGITKIDGGAFSNCISLEEIKLPDSLTFLSGFAGCKNLKTINIHDGITTIGRSGLSDTGLEEVYISSNMQLIDEYAFDQAKQLKKLVISNGLTDIRFHTFRGCEGLTDVYIPKSIKYVCYNSFERGDYNGLTFWIDNESQRDMFLEAEGKGALVKVLSDSDKNILIESLNINKDQLSMNVGEQIQLKAEVKPDNAFNKNVKWSSSDINIADVDSNGKVIAKRKGTVKITCTTKDGTNLSATCTVIVNSTDVSEGNGTGSGSTGGSGTGSGDNSGSTGENGTGSENNSGSTGENNSNIGQTENKSISKVYISGTEKVGKTLKANVKDSDGKIVKTGVKYTWYRLKSKTSSSKTEISDSSTYKLKSSDIGKYIKLVVEDLNGKELYDITDKIESSADDNDDDDDNSNSSTEKSTSSNKNSNTIITYNNALANSNGNNSYSLQNVNGRVVFLKSVDKNNSITSDNLYNTSTMANIRLNEINGRIYMSGSNGEKLSGWQKINGEWYLLSTNGQVATGWQYCDGKWYYLYENGIMAHDTYIEGYYLSSNGQLV